MNNYDDFLMLSKNILNWILVWNFESTKFENILKQIF
jgi:hypothetical protein